MDSRSVIKRIRGFANAGFGPPDLFLDVDSQRTQLDVYQQRAHRAALQYIADEAGVADMNTIKRAANIALGREWNPDRTLKRRH